MLDKVTIGKNIDYILTKRNIERKQVYLDLGIAKSTFGDIVNGKRDFSNSKEDLIKISKYLGIPYHMLINVNFNVDKNFVNQLFENDDLKLIDKMQLLYSILLSSLFLEDEYSEQEIEDFADIVFKSSVQKYFSMKALVNKCLKNFEETNKYGEIVKAMIVMILYVTRSIGYSFMENIINSELREEINEENYEEIILDKVKDGMSAYYSNYPDSKIKFKESFDEANSNISDTGMYCLSVLLTNSKYLYFAQFYMAFFAYYFWFNDDFRDISKQVLDDRLLMMKLSDNFYLDDFLSIFNYKYNTEKYKECKIK